MVLYLLSRYVIGANRDSDHRATISGLGMPEWGLFFWIRSIASQIDVVGVGLLRWQGIYFLILEQIFFGGIYVHTGADGQSAHVL